jgi:hypothetical protein
LIRSTSAPPSTAATAVLRRGPRTVAGRWWAMPLLLPLSNALPGREGGPLLGGKMVVRRVDEEEASLRAGGTEKRARSWASVSRMSVVMSWGWRRALVKILGPGKLGGVLLELGASEGCWGNVLEVCDCLGTGLDLF